MDDTASNVSPVARVNRIATSVLLLGAISPIIFMTWTNWHFGDFNEGCRKNGLDPRPPFGWLLAVNYAWCGLFYALLIVGAFVRLRYKPCWLFALGLFGFLVSLYWMLIVAALTDPMWDHALRIPFPSWFPR